MLAFRTFHGWTALSDMAHDQGVLHTVPIPEAMGYLMLRPLLPDVADEDMVHSVAPVQNQQGWGNVMYMPAAPWCPRNEQYAPSVREAFRTGSSPSDFPDENYERDWRGRFRFEDLSQIGRRGLGLS